MKQQSEQEAALDRLLRRVGTTIDVPPAGDCLDPETVAAMTDRALLPHEQSAAEAHASACPRCQELLAAVVRAAPEPSPVRPWWRTQGVPWPMPAAAATLAAVVWVALEVQSGRVPAVPVVVRTPAGESLSPRLGGPEPRPRQVAEKATAPDARTGREPEVTAQTDPSRLAQDFATPKPREEAALDPAPTAAEPTGPSASAPVTAGPKLQAPAAAAQNAMIGRSAPDTVGTEALAESGAADARGRTGLVLREIPSSDPRSRWRIIGSSVQRSVDEGRTWSTQHTGTTSRLTAGSAPQPDVCWIVGEDGLVLLTVDGLSWQRVKAPVDVPLVSVRATSAEGATIHTTDGRSFVTANAGRTWTLQ